MTSDHDMLAAKRALRAEMAQRRAGLSRASRGQGASAIAQTALDFLPPRPGAVISGYAAIGDELDPLPLLTQLWERGHPLALPVVIAKGQPLVFRQWRPGEALVKAGFGLSVPAESAQHLTPDILLVPLLAFDAHGYRLGYGGGFYDRTLAKLRAQHPVTAVGLAFEGQRLDNVPHAAYDEPLDWVLTPSGPEKFERV